MRQWRALAENRAWCGPESGDSPGGLLHQQEPGPAPGMMWLALQRPESSWGADFVQILMRAQNTFLLATPRSGGNRPGKKAVRRGILPQATRSQARKHVASADSPCTRSTRSTGCTGSTGRDSRELPIGCCLLNGPASGWSINPLRLFLVPALLPHQTAFSISSSQSQNEAEDLISRSTSPFSLWPNGAILSTAATAVDAKGQRWSAIHGLLYL